MTRHCELCGATGVLQAIGHLMVCVRQSCQHQARLEANYYRCPYCGAGGLEDHSRRCAGRSYAGAAR